MELEDVHVTRTRDVFGEASEAKKCLRAAQHKLLVASLLLVVRPGAPSNVLAPSSDALCS